MKTISGSTHRHDAHDMILRCGDFAYQYQPCWAHIPASFGNNDVVALACDDQDTLFVLTRHKEMPVMVFDQQGNFQRSFGTGLFPARPHGIFINHKGELYCTDDNSHIGIKMTRTGDVLATYGQANQPSDTGCDRNAYQKWREAEKFLPIRWLTIIFPCKNSLIRLCVQPARSMARPA